MSNVKFFGGEQYPVEMHKVRIVQKLTLLPIEERLKAIEGAGYNTFLLENKDVFLDMLTDSGVNAMSQDQQAAMFIADDAYAGSATYTRLAAKVREIFGMPYFLPCHQGRAAENILVRTLVSPGTYVPMNYHFTTSKQHVVDNGGEVLELITPAGLAVTSDEPFKGNMDVAQLRSLIAEKGADAVSFVRMEAGTNLIGGQPFSLANLREVASVCRENGLPRFLDHVDQHHYPAAALASAVYVASGVRGMERGTMSEARGADGVEPLAHMELVRLALPRRVFTLSQVRYAIDRLDWLHQNRHLVGGMRWTEEPEILRFFYGRLEPVTDWPQQLAAQFRADFGDSL